MFSTTRFFQTLGLASTIAACGARTGLEVEDFSDAGIADAPIAMTPISPVRCDGRALDHCVIQAASTYTATTPSTASRDEAPRYYSSVCALMADGHVKIRGHRTNGAAISTVPGLRDIVYVDGDSEGLLAFVSRNGAVWVWGNSGAPLGPGIPEDPRNTMWPGATGDAADTPMQVLGLSNIIQVAVGRFHILALDKGGHVWAWGRNSSGQLGDGATTETDTPVRVSALPLIRTIRAGWEESAALDTQGRVWTWGSSTASPADPACPPTTHNLSPVLTTGVPENIRDLHNIAGSYLALNGDGVLYGWGCNESAWLGTGSLNPQPTPTTIMNGVVSFNAYYTTALALNRAGQVFEWGEVGTHNTTSSPTPVSGLPNTIVSLDAGYRNHRIAVTRDGLVYIWGDATDDMPFGEGRPPVRVEF